MEAVLSFMSKTCATLKYEYLLKRELSNWASCFHTAMILLINFGRAGSLPLLEFWLAVWLVFPSGEHKNWIQPMYHSSFALYFFLLHLFRGWAKPPLSSILKDSPWCFGNLPGTREGEPRKWEAGQGGNLYQWITTDSKAPLCDPICGASEITS